MGLQQQKQQQRATQSTMVPLKDTTYSQFSQLKNDLQQTDGLTHFCDADGNNLAQNQNETGSEEQECKRKTVTSPEPPNEDVFLSMPPLMKKSNAVNAGVRWSDLVEAEELSFSKLTVKADETKLAMPSNEANHELDQISDKEHAVLLRGDCLKAQNDPLQHSDQLTDSSSSQTCSDAVDTQEPIE